MGRPLHVTVVDTPGDIHSPHVSGALVQSSGTPAGRPDWQGTWLERAPGEYWYNTWAEGVTPILLTVKKAGFHDFVAEYPIPATGPWVTNNFIGLTKLPPTPHLEVRGNDFVDAAGQRVCHSCVDAYPDLRLFADGRLAELEALVAERHEFGFQWNRVYGMADITQNFVVNLTPDEAYAVIRPYTDWMNTRGQGILLEVFVDNQNYQAGIPHWQRMADAVRGTCTILSGGNEWPKNGFDPDSLPDPGLIWTRGSGLADQATPRRGATCESFHQRTDWPATEMDAVASAINLRQNGATVVLMDEPTRFDDLGNKSGVPDSGAFAARLARVYGAYWGLACFHNYYGQRGLLMSANVRTVAAAWQRGLAL